MGAPATILMGIDSSVVCGFISGVVENDRDFQALRRSIGSDKLPIGGFFDLMMFGCRKLVFALLKAKECTTTFLDIFVDKNYFLFFGGSE